MYRLSFFLLIFLNLFGCQHQNYQNAEHIKAQPLPKIIEQTAAAPKLLFNLKVGKLEDNIQRLLVEHSNYQMLIWHVSDQHQVLAKADVVATNLYELIDKIITPYNTPAQIKAQFYQGNKVAHFYYFEADIY